MQHPDRLVRQLGEGDAVPGEGQRQGGAAGQVGTQAPLDAAGQVGGMALQAGDKLAFTQGCDVVLRRAGGREECFGLTDGALGPPR